MFPILQICCWLALSMWLMLTALPVAADTHLKIGVLGFRSPAAEQLRWQALIPSLQAALPDCLFDIEALSFQELELAVAARRLDFVLTNPSHYQYLAHRHGLSAPLATLVADTAGHRTAAFGGVVFVRHDRVDIREAADLRNKTIAASDRDSLGGYQAQVYELLQHRIKPSSLRWVLTGMPQDAVVDTVLQGKADAGFVRTGLLETLIQEGKLNAEQIKVIPIGKPPDFPVRVSTRLYPEWPFAALPMIDPTVAKKVTSVLFNLEDDPRLLQVLGIRGFDVPSDYRVIENVLRELGLPPFDRRHNVTLQDIWAKYAAFIIALSAAMAMIVTLLILLLQRHRWIKRQHKELQAMIHEWPKAMLLLEDERFIEVNPAAAALFGFDHPGELVGKTPMALSPTYQPDGQHTETKARRLLRDTAEQGCRQFEWQYVRRDGKTLMADVSLAAIELNGRRQFMVGIHDLTQQKANEDIIKRQSGYLSLLLDLSSTFIHLPVERFDDHLRHALSKVARFVNADRAYVFLYDNQRGKASNTHEWCADGVMPAIDLLQNLSQYDYPEWFDAHRRGEALVIRDIAAYPATNVRAKLEQQGIKSLIALPMMGETACLGCVGFDYVKQARVFQPEETQLLTLFASLLVNIQQRRQADNALRQALDQIGLFFDINLDLFCIANTRGNFVRLNPEWQSVLGYPLAELEGRSFLEFVHPEDLPSTRQVITELRHQQVVNNFENRYLHRDGSYRWIEWRSYPQGEMIYASARDVTHRKLTEKALRESATLFRAVFDNAAIGLAQVAVDGQFLQVNREFCSLLGYSQEEIRERRLTYKDITHPDDLDISNQYVVGIMAGTYARYDLEKRYVSKSGDLVWVHLSNYLERDADGAPLYFVAAIADIRQRKQAEQALRLSEQKLRAFYDLAPLGIAATDMNGRFLEFNQAFKDICGYDADELHLLDYWTLTPETYRRDEARQMALLNSVGRYGPYEKHYRRKDGSLIPINLNGLLMTGPDGQPQIWSIVEDITERKRVEQNLQLAACVFSHAREGIMLTELDGTIIDVNDAFTEITGYPKERVLGKTPRLLKSGRYGKDFYVQLFAELNQNGHWSGEIWNRRRNGDEYAQLATISVVRDRNGDPWRYVSLFFDITAIKQQQQQLEMMAHFDLLTGLPNRVLLNRYLEQGMAVSRRSERMMAVVFIDLDGFKAVNDSYGHDIGDKLLKSIAKSMLAAMRAGDTLARLGGDEFVAVLLELDNPSSCEPVLQRLLDIIGEPQPFLDEGHQVTASIGVSFYPQSADIDAEQLLRQADQAMYQAKLAGKNRYHLFDSVVEDSVRQHHEQLRQITDALQQHQFELHYQPKVNMRSGEVIGAEALLRWHHPERGLLSPALFLPAVESHPLDIRIGEWVIESALRQIAEWQQHGLTMPVSVNISPYHLQQGDFIERLKTLLARYPAVNPACLELEVLESNAFDSLTHTQPLFNRCRELGVGFALDDFGTGYSSMNYLKHLPLSHLKIDQSFVRDLLDDPDDLAILEGIVRISDVFQFRVIAEGVETIQHGEMLLMLGCEMAQGYGIARPMPASALPAWIAAWQPDPIWRHAPVLSSLDQSLLIAFVQLRAWVKALASSGARPPLAKWRLPAWLRESRNTVRSQMPVFSALAALPAEVERVFADYEQLRSDDVDGLSACLHRLDSLLQTMESAMSALRLAGKEPVF